MFLKKDKMLKNAKWTETEQKTGNGHGNGTGKDADTIIKERMTKNVIVGARYSHQGQENHAVIPDNS